MQFRRSRLSKSQVVPVFESLPNIDTPLFTGIFIDYGSDDGWFGLREDLSTVVIWAEKHEITEALAAIGLPLRAYVCHGNAKLREEMDAIETDYCACCRPWEANSPNHFAFELACLDMVGQTIRARNL